ncbi:transcriptional regulator [Burkholderia gladioli]|uniref:transcriptional regulator n=1 Tax=Burkholderia gladioli TaxID=28095 RepID=UPI00164151ED|nr:YdaS family helix-turn-helix protein [Burkholderia gladioli]
MTTKFHLKRAIEILGSQEALGAAIGVTQQTISYWLKTGIIRPEHCIAIEAATQGLVSRCDLRPDDWQKIWPEFSPTAGVLA